jgi:predicted small metal-binding protein
MDKIIHCKDLGSDCSFTACRKTEVELYEEILDHGQTIHGMKEFSKEFYDKVRASLRDGYCDLQESLCEYSVCCCA